MSDQAQEAAKRRLMDAAREFAKVEERAGAAEPGGLVLSAEEARTFRATQRWVTSLLNRGPGILGPMRGSLKLFESIQPEPTPEPEAVDLEALETECEFSPMRHGTQNVVLTHKPTRIILKGQGRQSYTLNKRDALMRLASMLGRGAPHDRP